MCRQPPFFWMRALHFGHGRVCIATHDALPTSASARASRHAPSHDAICAHVAGSCGGDRPHAKQNSAPHAHATRTPRPSAAACEGGRLA
eukprot:159927-Chlamydomonas_euryale.AAC.1